MEYSELVERIKNHESIPVDKVEPIQIFKLLFDRLVPGVEYNKSVYEINFIPASGEDAFYSDVIEEECTTLFDLRQTLSGWVERYNRDMDTYIQFEHKYYKIILEVLETP